MLVHAQLIGADLATYLEQHHPVQQAILEIVSLSLESPRRDRLQHRRVRGPGVWPALARDGTGLREFGRSWRRSRRGHAASGGHGRFQHAAKALLRRGHGADLYPADGGPRSSSGREGRGRGVYCAGLPEKGWGIALKVHDGAGRATGPAIIEILAALGLIGEEAAQNLEEHRRPVVTNHAGVTVGQIEAGLRQDLKLGCAISPKAAELGRHTPCPAQPAHESQLLINHWKFCPPSRNLGEGVSFARDEF